MLKVLLKKQFFEIFKGYFYNAKTNKKRTKIGTIGYFIFFFVIMVGVLGGMFFGLSFALLPLVKVGYGWLYYVILSMLSILLGVFGCVFNSYNSLYLAKDNDLLLSMPIPISNIITSRLLGVYLLGLMYSGVVIIPAEIVYLALGQFSIQGLVGAFILWLQISIFVLLLSCLLGFVVAKLSLKFKNKSIMATIISLVCIGIYYFFYFKAQEMIQDVVANALVFGEEIKTKVYGLYLFGGIGQGNITSILFFSVIICLLTLVTYLLLKKTFVAIAISTGVSTKHIYKETKTKQNSPFKALLKKELKRFTSSSTYMLNCGLGLVFIIAGGVAIVLKGDSIVAMLNEAFGQEKGSIKVLLFVSMSTILSTVNMVVPSVSLEGKNLWVLKSLPIKTWEVFKAKMALQVVLTIIPLLCLCFCVGYSFSELGSILYLIFISVLLAFVCNTLFGMFLAVKMPLLNWTNEIYPIKQSGNVAIALLTAMIFPIAIAILYMMKLYTTISAVNYLLMVDGLLLVLSLIFYIWLKSKGVKEFEKLN